jgi:hypothetical protein
VRSSIVVLVLGFTALGLLLGTAQVRNVEPQTERDPNVQQALFDECINRARSAGELTDDEYYRCAYDIYD